MNQTFPMPLVICNLKLISAFFLHDLDGTTVQTCVTALCKTVVINPQASFVCESLVPHELCCLDSTAFAMLLQRSLTYNGHILFKISHICLSFSRPCDTLQQAHINLNAQHSGEPSETILTIPVFYDAMALCQTAPSCSLVNKDFTQGIIYREDVELSLPDFVTTGYDIGYLVHNFTFMNEPK